MLSSGSRVCRNLKFLSVPGFTSWFKRPLLTGVLGARPNYSPYQRPFDRTLPQSLATMNGVNNVFIVGKDCILRCRSVQSARTEAGQKLQSLSAFVLRLQGLISKRRITGSENYVVSELNVKLLLKGLFYVDVGENPKAFFLEYFNDLGYSLVE